MADPEVIDGWEITRDHGIGGMWSAMRKPRHGPPQQVWLDGNELHVDNPDCLYGMDVPLAVIDRLRALEAKGGDK